MYRQARRRERGNVEGPPGVFLRVSYIRLEDSSAHRDVCPHNRPLRLLYSCRKSYFFWKRGATHSRTSYNYIFTSYALDKQTLPWSKTLSEKKISRWLVRPRFIFTSISFVRHRASGSKVWRESSRRWINFSSDKDTVRKRKVWKRQVKEWEIC